MVRIKEIPLWNLLLKIQDELRSLADAITKRLYNDIMIFLDFEAYSDISVKFSRKMC